MEGFLTEETIRHTLSGLLEAGEVLGQVQRGVDSFGRPHMLAETDRRALLVRFSKSFDLNSAKTIPLNRLEKKLKGYARLEGLALAPPATPLVRGDGEYGLFMHARDTVSESFGPGEKLITLGLCREREAWFMTSYYYVAFTDSRVLLMRLSKNREVEEVESVPLEEVSGFSLLHDRKPVPIDTPLFSGQELSLQFRFADGRERSFLLTDLHGHRREDAPD